MAVAVPEGVSRRHFLRLAGAAGITVATTSASGSLLAACARKSTNRDTLKVGVMAPFSGVGEFIGTVVDNSLEAAVRQVNADGGATGRKVELLLRDTEADVAATTRAYDELAATKGLLGILWCGAVGFEALLPRIKQDGVPVVAVFEDPFSRRQLYPQGAATGRSVFQLSLPDSFVNEVLADYARNDRGYTSAALVYDRDLESGFDVPGATKARFQQAFGGAGLAVKGVETFATADQDYSAQLGRLQAAAPQVLYLDGLSDNTGAIAMALSDMGAEYVDTPTAKGPAWHPHLFGSYRGINHLWADVATEAAKVGSVTAWHVGGLSFLPSFAIGQWMKKYLGKDVNGGEEMPANALATLLRGLKKAGSADRQRLVEGIETMGPVTFASVPFGFTKDRHHATTKEDVVLLTLERLRGPADTDPPYQLGAEWQEGGAFASRGASATLLARPTLAANRSGQPDVMAQILRGNFGTQCTKHADGTLGPECKVH